ncbi:MAG: hypothetical protein AAF495_28855 [Pseudomonadota bacterium]
MRRGLLAALIGLVLLAAPAQAQAPDKEEVFSALVGLIDRGPDRRFFGLPEETHWRPGESVSVGLFSADFESQRRVLQSLAAQIDEHCGISFQTILAVNPNNPDQAFIQVVPQLQITVGPRQEMAQASEPHPVNLSALERFEDGRWPFLFAFPREQVRLGQVWIADDEPAPAIEAALILSLFWGLGAATLGGDLAGLVDRSGDQPHLTPLGQEVLAVLCAPELEAGLTIPETLARARQVLGLDG